ncbi:MAG: exosortase O [Hellea sp.]
MEAASEKLTHNTVSGQAALSALGLAGLVAGYALITLPAFIWIKNELEPQLLIFTFAAIIVGLILLIWKFGLPVKPLTIPAIGLIAISGLLSNFSFPILQQLSASFALLGVYGFFAGLSGVSDTLWRKGLIMGGLTALALPFALVPGTGMGFYLRLLTADAAAQLLALMGHASLGAHDVLIFDNGIAQVDLPCSGLKSLFTGTAFFCVASLVLRREVNLKWIISYSIFAGLLIVANTIRVTLLIWISEVLLYRDIAETIHMPMGLMLFCIVCMCGVYMLYKLKPFRSGDNDRISSAKISSERYAALTSSLLCVLIAAIFIAAMVMSPPQDLKGRGAVTLPSDMAVTSVQLTPTETRFFGARERTFAGKWLFEYQNLSGSMLVVRSGAANGLHAPEVCMLGNGISVDHMESRDFGAGQYRFLTVDNERRNAVYWMQGDRTITDDFRKRLNNFIFGQQDDWVMVTILLDERLNLAETLENTASLESLMQKLQSHYDAEINRKPERQKADTNEPR